MKKVFGFLFIFSLFLLGADDVRNEIGMKGDTHWEQLLDQLERRGELVHSITSASAISDRFANYEGHSMVFPRFSFEDFVVDRNGDKYYYYGERDSLDFFVIKYDDRITQALRDYSYAIGSPGSDEWQLLGTIEEVYSWWGDIVLMDIQALHVPGVATLAVEGEELNFVASELISQLMEERAQNGIGDVPRGLTTIPSDLDAMTVAKLYFQLGSVEQNEELWLELLAADNFWGGSPERRVSSWWDTLTGNGWDFYYVRTAEDGAERKKYFFQIQNNGVDMGSPKPLTVVLEDGQWKVASGI